MGTGAIVPSTGTPRGGVDVDGNRCKGPSVRRELQPGTRGEAMTDAATDPVAEPEESPADGGKRVKFPAALTVLAIVLGAVWLASFFIPSGIYKLDPETGSPIPGTYEELAS